MTNNYFISIYLDTRRKKKNDRFPVKLRVFTSNPREQKLYPTKFEFTEDEFKSIWQTEKPRNEHKKTRSLLRAIEENAEKSANELQHFTFGGFEKLLFSDQSTQEMDIAFYYEQAIEEYKRNRRIGTASNYEYSLKSLVEFQGKDKLKFNSINVQWLRDFENHLVEQKKLSKTTVGMYLRPLRAIFNTAKIKEDQYPFGKNKYSIPNPKGLKKALSKAQMKVLFDAEPVTPEQQKAKAFWFFSYASNGMNFKDIANLQYKDISGDELTFRRAKTSITNSEQSPVRAYLNEFTQSVIQIYGNVKINPETFIFPIVNHGNTPTEQHQQLKNFIRFINQHFEKYAKSMGIKEKVSTYWARHSFATIAIRNGASLEFVSEALSHSNLKTTIGYFAGFEDEKKREISKKMMEF